LVSKYRQRLKKVLIAIFVDLRRAFPSVDCQKLIDCLIEIGVPTEFVDIIADILSANRFRIKTTDHYTPWAPVNVGVREGGVLSPLLFSLFFADIVSSVFQRVPTTPGFFGNDETGAGVFADDLVFFGLSHEYMQEKLNELERYCDRKGLSVNVDKTEVLVFTPNINPPQLPPLYYKGAQLPSTSEFKYLGFWLADSGNCKIHMDKHIPKVSAAASSHSFHKTATDIMPTDPEPTVLILGFLTNVWL
jgi:hypothetical protein